MTDEIMIVVAPVPGEKQDEKYPGPIDIPGDVISSEAAGASIVHLHSRDANLLQTADPTRFEEQVGAIRAACPIIIEGSTGGAPEHTIDERCAVFGVPGVEIGSLNLGSINMYDGVYQNPDPEMRLYAQRLRAAGITPVMPVFDLSHLTNYRRLLDDDEIALPYLFEFVFDVPNALPYSDRYLELFVEHLPEDAIWFCVRHHQRGAADLSRVIELGGHLRVGYEDSPFLSDGRRAASNAELVADAAEVAARFGRRVVRADRAREIIGLR
jgi:3-keto-5-aminohexanoate cleavage enzyme